MGLLHDLVTGWFRPPAYGWGHDGLILDGSQSAEAGLATASVVEPLRSGAPHTTTSADNPERHERLPRYVTTHARRTSVNDEPRQNRTTRTSRTQPVDRG